MERKMIIDKEGIDSFLFVLWIDRGVLVSGTEGFNRKWEVGDVGEKYWLIE